MRVCEGVRVCERVCGCVCEGCESVRMCVKCMRVCVTVRVCGCVRV